jgi:hypothetical protein
MHPLLAYRRIQHQHEKENSGIYGYPAIFCCSASSWHLEIILVPKNTLRGSRFVVHGLTEEQIKASEELVPQFTRPPVHHYAQGPHAQFVWASPCHKYFVKVFVRSA